MLLNIDLQNRIAERVRGVSLKSFGLDERAFQDILYKSLE
jgi:hypothetical protein